MSNITDSEHKFNSINIGDTFSFEKKISEEMVENFAKLSGDYNPVHMDDTYCIQHGINSRIVHGMLVLSFVSTLIGMYLPGEGAVWLSQSFDFISPTKIDDTITISGRVTGKNNTNSLGLNILDIKIDIKNQLKSRIARGNVKVSIK